jgi:membrane protease YdiL (CAAX protease family)
MLSSIAIGIGLSLGPHVNLKTPLLSKILSGEPGWLRRGRAPTIAALLAGIAVAIAIALADPWLEGLMPAWPESARQAEEVAKNMASWKPLLASFSAGVTEELLFRFGLMTLLVWLGTKVSRRPQPGSFVLGLAIILTALVFSLAHLANVVELAISITPGTLLYLVITNGVGGLVFGWLYARFGLESAVLAHILADVGLKVAVPLLQSAVG